LELKTSPTATSVTRLEWFVLGLLVISVCINYVDRGTLSVTGVALSKELHLRPHELGFLLSAFFWTYAGLQVVAGWLIDRYNVILVYAIGFAIWSGATVLTGLASGFVTLFALRLLLGIGESVAYPSYSKIIAASFPERQRGMANGLIDVGCKLGPAAGMIVGGLLLDNFGWRWVFLTIGLASLLWLIPWSATAPRMRTAASLRAPYKGPGLIEILKNRSAWGTLIGLFCGNYAWYFMLTWLPQYLLMERHYSTRIMALTGWLPFCSTAAGAAFGGWLSDRLIHNGASPTVVRKTFAVSGLSGSALFLLPAAMAEDQILAMTLLMLSAFIYGLFSSNLWAITQTLAGEAAAGKWTGLQNCMGNMAGVVAPIVTGFIVYETGKFYWAFVCVCVILAIGALSYLLIVQRIAQVAWSTSGDPAATSHRVGAST
jgi:ACS family D-galactonate transporter-like MFS transporter